MGYDDRAQSTAKTPDEDGNLHPSTKFLGDFSVLELYREDSPPGPRTYELWSMYFDDVNTVEDAERKRNAILAMFPGQVRTVGGWWNTGEQVGTEHVYSTRTVTKTWSILNPDYQPDPEEPDFDDRFVLSVTGEVEEEYISGFTGTPTFPLHTRILEYIPDLRDPDGLPIGRPTEVTDVNLGMGQSTRSFF